MAAAFFNQFADAQKAWAVSAGTEPGPHVHPVVLQVMAEAGVDLSHARPQLLTEELARGATILVTMGCGEKCPYIPGLLREDWPLPDPKSLPIEEARKVRDEVKRHVEDLIIREHLR
jgi:arsenate reductase